MKNKPPYAIESVDNAARRNGYAINNQQTETGLTALGVALRRPHGQVLAGVSLAMPTARCYGAAQNAHL